MGWCDDTRSIHYNKQIKLPSKLRHEILYRKDNIYDIICVINYNINPTLKNKGSAIFLHIAKKKYQSWTGHTRSNKDRIKNIMKAKEFIPAEKPRNFVAKNAKMGGAGQHKDKKKADKFD